MARLTDSEITEMISHLPDWSVVDEDGMKNESKFDKQLQESEEKFKSDSQNNWLKKDDDDDDIIDYVYESNTGIKKPDDDEKN